MKGTKITTKILLKLHYVIVKITTKKITRARFKSKALLIIEAILLFLVDFFAGKLVKIPKHIIWHRKNKNELWSYFLSGLLSFIIPKHIYGREKNMH